MELPSLVKVFLKEYGFCILFHMVYVNPYGFNDVCIGDLLYPQKGGVLFLQGCSDTGVVSVCTPFSNTFNSSPAVIPVLSVNFPDPVNLVLSKKY